MFYDAKLHIILGVCYIFDGNFVKKVANSTNFRDVLALQYGIFI